ncbi:hypothetical protein KEM54_004786, partial [Ascosphaera aggregata]
MSCDDAALSADRSQPQQQQQQQQQQLQSQSQSQSQPQQLYTHSIDNERLKQLYERHKGFFWSIIAAEYSEDSELPPQLLESTFLEEIRRLGIK